MTFQIIPAKSSDTLDHDEGVSCWCLPSVIYCECDAPCQAIVIHATHGMNGKNSWHDHARSIIPARLIQRGGRRWAV